MLRCNVNNHEQVWEKYASTFPYAYISQVYLPSNICLLDLSFMGKANQSLSSEWCPGFFDALYPSRPLSKKEVRTRNSSDTGIET